MRGYLISKVSAFLQLCFPTPSASSTRTTIIYSPTSGKRRRTTVRFRFRALLTTVPFRRMQRK
ncbi:hypothetical protein I7I53_00440 [Histoplasma capsulatum var. duboisii H88]|uniref:Uncharacterized protein n=1 Tax=Ajellomyces capsulatus (strain H88) TaxID=544711 RepID=A0A8A1LJU4_AJEC8|nr:hypothetical protein I7I53_00440 [Histoplasma capsulatum var. duboisii H88]